ncbi:MAG: nucleotide exchange factor GrpE [Candidatus Methanoplasma sp.]|jgi:molecular chaperone GrpE (heat shock protein)|nr:nucleotide exchange factor GrpE [Candidatus Methanoplasma sp.]
MTEKRRSTKASKLKNFLVTGSIDDMEEDCVSEEDGEILYDGDGSAEHPAEDLPEYEAEYAVEVHGAPEEVPAIGSEEDDARAENIPAADTSALEREVAELKEMIACLTAELQRYTTSKEQLKEYSQIVNRRDAELSNRKFIGMLEQLSAMREDFFKLCEGMNAKLDSFSPKDMIGSFEAYGVDMENILTDCGVQIGGSGFERLNTMHQRIVDVIPTDDEAMNGMIAERVSDGYEYQGRVLLKEKVKIYRFSGNGKKEGDEEK